jgi:hypothetical protein
MQHASNTSKLHIHQEPLRPKSNMQGHICARHTKRQLMQLPELLHQGPCDLVGSVSLQAHNTTPDYGNTRNQDRRPEASLQLPNTGCGFNLTAG